MTQEEKAKRYNEALEIAKKNYITAQDLCEGSQIGVECFKNTLENIFPELKESEDEKIRKELTEFLKSASGGFLDTAIQCKTFGKWVAWLEKQGKKPQGKSALEAIKEEKVDNQNCVKPTNTVEPKFHEGMWLTENHPNNYARFVQILEIVNVQGKKRYRISRDLHNDEDIVECRFIEDNWHQFNIQDAKDGDVLAFDDDTIVIFKDLYNSTSFHSYCHIENGIFDFNKDELPDWWNCEGFEPATKEQCDLLFTKMKEAGYEWDAEKKESKKIENVVCSEEDEHWRQKAIDFIKHPDLIKATPTLAKDTINWLKSIKERIGE